MKGKNKKTLSILYVADAVLLLLCILKMPYGFYKFVRFVVAASFLYIAYLQYKSKNIDRMILFGAFAVMFQPFIPLSFGRFIWVVFDIIIAVYLLYILSKMNSSR